jgi:hypothetical protein
VTGHRRGRLAIAALLLLSLTACGTAAGDVAFEQRSAPTSGTLAPTTTTVPPATTAPPPTTARAPRPTAPPTTPRPTQPPRPRVVTEEEWTPFAQYGGVVLHHPSRRVERVGFHESNNDGARELEVLPTAVDPITLQTRDRGTGDRTAADIVSDPDVEVRAPVSGVVLRSGGYTLYCKYHDDFVVIEPDEHPGWEVKVLHINGVLVHKGDRVIATQTVLAPRPTRLPFRSDVDDTTAPPPWPHVHVELVDPSIPDRPSPGC